MRSTVRFRLSLLARVCVAVALLAVVGTVAAVVVAVVGGVVGVYVGGIASESLVSLAGLPRLSSVLPVPAAAVAATAAATATWVLWGLPFLSRPLERSELLPPRDPGSVALVAVLACALYLSVVEAAPAGSALLSQVLETGRGLALLFGAGAVVAVGASAIWARREVDGLRDRLRSNSRPAGERHPEVEEAVGRLARQADVPPPTVRVTDTDRPESFALGSGRDAVVVVSTGLLEALSPAERRAVLAHEVSHLASADSRIMAAALVPALVADDWMDADPDRLVDYLLNGVFGLLKPVGQFGMAVLSRGREWSADAGAVALTGSPAALASALATMAERRRRPATDLRNWEDAVAALDVLPAAERHAGVFRTHPPTEERIEWLRSRAERAERE